MRFGKRLLCRGEKNIYSVLSGSVHVAFCFQHTTSRSVSFDGLVHDTHICSGWSWIYSSDADKMADIKVYCYLMLMGFHSRRGAPLNRCLAWGDFFLQIILRNKIKQKTLRTCTLDSGKLILSATSSRIKISGYLVLPNSDSRMSSWARVKVVRSRRCFRGFTPENV